MDRSLVATWLVKRESAAAPAKPRRRRGVLARKRADEGAITLLVVEDEVAGMPHKVWEAVADAIDYTLSHYTRRFCPTAKAKSVKTE